MRSFSMPRRDFLPRVRHMRPGPYRAVRATLSLLLLILLAGCGSGVAETAVTATATTDLPPRNSAQMPPTLPPRKPGDQSGPSLPPPAYLVVDGTAYPATYGTYCYGGGCVDMVAPEQMPEVKQASVPDGEPVKVRIDSHGPVELSATLRPWSDQPPADGNAGQSLDAHGERVDDATIYTLDPLPDTDDQVLIAFTRFTEGGDASYIWRINSSQ